MVVAFTLLMGASQGVITIVRGAVPLALFGVKGYGAVLGAIATPVLVISAASPTAFAWIVDRWGWGTARVVHTPRDTTDRLTLEGVRKVAAGVARVLSAR